jgi:hypothetical protein
MHAAERRAEPGCGLDREKRLNGSQVLSVAWLALLRLERQSGSRCSSRVSRFSISLT